MKQIGTSSNSWLHWLCDVTIGCITLLFWIPWSYTSVLSYVFIRDLVVNHNTFVIHVICTLPIQERLRRNQDGINIGSDDEFILVGNNREQQQEVWILLFYMNTTNSLMVFDFQFGRNLMDSLFWNFYISK